MGAAAAAEPSQAPARVWARVKSQDQLADKLYRLTLTAPAIAATAQPGQFVMLRVRHGADPLLARPFSVHGVEGEDVVILYRVVGRGTSVLSLARPGKSLFMWGPLGRGFDLTVENPVLVSGGMGRAPIAFAAEKLRTLGKQPIWLHGGPSDKEIKFINIEIKHYNKKKVGFLTDEYLYKPDLYENKMSRYSSKNITIGDILIDVNNNSVTTEWRRSIDLPNEDIKNTFDAVILVATEDGSFGRRGLVTDLESTFLQNSPPLFQSSFLACGPLPMLKAVAKLAAKHGAACQVSLEAPMACGIGVCLGCALPAAGGGYVRVCQEGPVMDAKRVDWGAM